MTEALQQEIRTLRSLHNSERDPEGRVFAPLADAYRRAGQIPEAVRLLNDGLSRHPDFVTGHVVAAQLYVEQGLGEEAGFAARRALDLDPDNVNALRSLLRVLEERGDESEASEVRGHLVSLEPGFESGDATPPARTARPPKTSRTEQTLVLDTLEDAQGESVPEPMEALGAPGGLSLAATPDVDVEDIDVEAGGDAISLDAESSFDDERTLAAHDPLEISLGAAEQPGEEEALSSEQVFDLSDLTAVPAGPEHADAGLPTPDAGLELEGMTPDPEPTFELDSLATDDSGGGSDATVTKIGLLAAEEPETTSIGAAGLPDPEPVFDLGALAPDEPEEPVLEMGALAPDEPEEPVLEMAALAPDEPEEPVLEMAALAPDEPDEPVLEVAALAPDEPDEPVLEVGALAPDEPVLDMDALAPDWASGGGGDDVIEVEFLAPDEPDEIVIDLDALRPDGAEFEDPREEEAWVTAAEEGGEEAALDGGEPEDVRGEDTVEDPVDDDADAGEPVYTRTLAELYVKQGAIERALGVLRHLHAANPGDRELAERIAQLEEGGDVDAEMPGATEPGRRPWQPDEGADEAVSDSGEPDAELEELARDLAQSGDAGHDVDTPFAWGEQKAESPPAGDPSIRDYFDGLLAWESGEES